MQAQAGASALLRRRVLVGPEEALAVRRRQARPGVGDVSAQQAARRLRGRRRGHGHSLRLQRHAHAHGAAAAKLEAIAAQIDQNLSDAAGIALHQRRQLISFRLVLPDQLPARSARGALAAAQRAGLQHVAHGGRGREGLAAQRQLAALQRVQRHHVALDAQQQVAAGRHGARQELRLRVGGDARQCAEEAGRRSDVLRVGAKRKRAGQQQVAHEALGCVQRSHVAAAGVEDRAAAHAAHLQQHPVALLVKPAQPDGLQRSHGRRVGHRGEAAHVCRHARAVVRVHDAVLVVLALHLVSAEAAQREHAGAHVEDIAHGADSAERVLRRTAARVRHARHAQRAPPSAS